jgi:glycosyltransferase involved in cell wall biosynthesis
MRCCYELPIGYWRAGLEILSLERDRRPEWAATIDVERDSDEKRMRKDAELEAADHVIVPSDFVRDTLAAHPTLTAPVDVIPYGAPPPRLEILVARRRATKLRLLFVGQLSQRKGISYLFEAMRRLHDEATLTLVGQKPDGECAALTDELKRHNWLGTVPHSRVLEIMAQHDVFIFPSLFEGFALVLLEAMAQGLPVITTRNSGGNMAVHDGADGFIIPIRDPEAIVRCVSLLADDRERLESMSRAALAKAAQMSWASREEAFIGVIREHLSGRAA